MGSSKEFKPVDLDYRGEAYAKHHSAIIGASRRFIADKPCPKCGEYLRLWQAPNYSACVSCHQQKRNKLADKSACEKRRAIEAHQEMLRERGEYE